MTNPVFLIGARASGKTTLGAALADALGFAFRDSDVELQRDCGMSVAEIVDREGWPGFRRRERETLLRLAHPETVIATGGGMVLDPDNRAFMRGSGRVLYLSAPAAVLAARLASDPKAGQRPSLTGVSVVEEMGQILAEREPLYREAAHHLLDATVSLEKQIQEVLAVLGESPR